MWKCHKCGKPVYFAERKQSLGYDWHPECLRCEECSKRLNPGQHAEHKGVPYCHVPCYGALFGPQLFGHGTRVESHSSFGKVENRSGGGPNMPRSHLESKLKLFNQFYDGNSGEIRSREVNGRLVLEGALRIHWGVLGLIHLKEDDDQRTVITVRKRNSYRSGAYNDIDFEASDGASVGDVTDTSLESASIASEEAPPRPRSASSSTVPDVIAPRALTLPPKLDVKRADWDELDDLLQVERVVDDTDKLYQTMPSGIPSSSERLDISPSLSTQSSLETSESASGEEDDSHPDKNLNRSMSGPDCLERNRNGKFYSADKTIGNVGDRLSGEADNNTGSAVAGVVKLAEVVDSDESDIEYDDSSDHGGVVLRRAAKTGSTAIRRRPGKRRSRTALKRRCSINGHFYDRETSFFTPPRGSTMSVWVSSLVSTMEVINLLLDKYKVDSLPKNFALFVIRDNGEQRRLREEEYPLLVRVMLGPHEDVAKLYIMDAHKTAEISCEVAQFLNLSGTECRAILDQYRLEEEREAKRVRAKFREMRKRIKQRMEDLKVRL